MIELTSHFMIKYDCAYHQSHIEEASYVLIPTTNQREIRIGGIYSCHRQQVLMQYIISLHVGVLSREDWEL